jgi:hypothetical protein
MHDGHQGGFLNKNKNKNYILKFWDTAKLAIVHKKI